MLAQDRLEVKQTLKRVENATQETWDDVRESARNTFQDVKREINELEGRVDKL